MRTCGEIAIDVVTCAEAHVPDSRLIGNVRADELRKLARVFLNAQVARKEMVPEVVICAAVRLPDGRVIRGHRHEDCLKTAYALVEWQSTPESGINGPLLDVVRAQMHADSQGFVTSLNRYVTRAEGLALQLAAGVESVAKGGYRRVLFSEDLY